MRNRRKTTLWAISAALLASFVLWGGGGAERQDPRSLIAQQVASRPLSLASVRKRWVAMLLIVKSQVCTPRRDRILNSWPGLDQTDPIARQAAFFRMLLDPVREDRAEPYRKFALHRAMSENEQLEVFINRARFARWGRCSIVGFPDAARPYTARIWPCWMGINIPAWWPCSSRAGTFDPAGHRAANQKRFRRIDMLMVGRCRPCRLNDVHYSTCR